MANDLLNEAINADLAGLWNLAGVEKDDDDEVKAAYELAKHGINLHCHIQHFLQHLYKHRDREATILLANGIYPEEEVWEEEEARTSALRKALIRLYSDEAPYAGR